MRRTALLVAALLLPAGLPDAVGTGVARAEGQGLFAVSCVQGYAKAFAEVNGAATALQLKLDNAQAEVVRAFKERPPRCEAGAYDYYLDQLMQFVRRALRSGATPQTPKDGWVRAAASLMDFAPGQVPRAEYYADLQRFQATRKELLTLITEAGAGPLSSALAAAFERAAPVPGAYGPPPEPNGAPAAVPAARAAPPAAGPQVYVPASPAAPAAESQVYAAPSPPAAANASTAAVPAYINFPRTPLPDWAVVHLYEVRDLIKSGREVEARAKLEQVLRWIEQR